MVSWTTMHYSMGLRSIEAAYRSSRDGFAAELSRVNAEWEQHIQNPAAGDYADQYSDHLSDDAFDAENGLRLIREAFALTLYHYWEKEVCALLGLRKVDHKTICKEIDKDGRLGIDRPGIDRLYLIANTIKHNNGFPLYDADSTLFSSEAKQLDRNDRVGWQFFLRLREEDITKAIAAVRVSGPGPSWRDGSAMILDDDGD